MFVRDELLWKPISAIYNEKDRKSQFRLVIFPWIGRDPFIKNYTNKPKKPFQTVTSQEIVKLFTLIAPFDFLLIVDFILISQDFIMVSCWFTLRTFVYCQIPRKVIKSPEKWLEKSHCLNLARSIIQWADFWFQMAISLWNKKLWNFILRIGLLKWKYCSVTLSNYWRKRIPLKCRWSSHWKFSVSL